MSKIKIISLKKEIYNQLQTSQFSTEIDVQTQEILDLVIEKTKGLYFNDFINFVYSTYPIIKNTKYSTLNLVQDAEEYRAQQHNN